MTDEMMKIIESKESHIVVQAYAGCVDKDTEYFNGNEWVKICDYKKGDMVLQFNEYWQAELVNPISYIKNPRDKMYKISTKYGVDMMLSENHRVIYIDKSKGFEFGKNNLLEIECNDLVARHNKNKSGFTGSFLTTFSIKNETDLDISEDELRLNMAIICDGNIVNENTKNIRINLKKDRKKARIVDILEKMNIEYNVVHKDDGYSIYTFKYDKAVKKFDYKWLFLPKNKRMVLFEEIPYWDGAIKTNISGYSRYYSTIKHNADFIQMLASSLNIRATIYEDNRVGTKSNDKYIRKSICYNVLFTNKTIVGIGRQSKVENKDKCISYVDTEDGFEYCFKVPSGMLVLRRGDNIFITGNCGKSTTMLEYVKANPNERILFMVFNKEMQMDFANRLKGINHNCMVTTIHSLAYRWYMSQGYPKKHFKNISIIDIKNILGGKMDYEKLSKVKFYFDMFLTSNVETPKNLTPLKKEDKVFFKYVDRLWEHFRVYSDFMPHNVYLKMYQLAKIKLNFETIIADELNDCNEVMLDLLVNNMDKKIIAVGDSQQAIMSFSFCIDGLTTLRDKYGFKEYTLTNSFRVSEPVAELSSRFLTYMKDKPIKFHGLSKTKIGKLNLLEADSKTNQIHLLCRTKLGGLKEVADLLDKDDSKKIYYVGGLEGFGINEIERILAYRGTVYIGGEKFHINQLRAMLKKGVEDAEISRICSIYGFVEKNEDMIDILKSSETKSKKDADIIVLTSHVSKGLTLENTLLARDFPPVEEIKRAIEKLKDSHSYIYNMASSEANLLYVAITRSTGILDIGSAFKRDELLSDNDKIQGDLESSIYLK